MPSPNRRRAEAQLSSETPPKETRRPLEKSLQGRFESSEERSGQKISNVASIPFSDALPIKFNHVVVARPLRGRNNNNNNGRKHMGSVD